MAKFGGCGAIVVAMFSIASACSLQADRGKSVVPGTGGAGGGGTGGPPSGAGGGAGGKDAGPPDDAVVCCPYDHFPFLTTTGHFGGTAFNGRCDAMYDVFCPINWRLETDNQGCPIVRVDSDPNCPRVHPPLDASDASDANASDAD